MSLAVNAPAGGDCGEGAAGADCVAGGENGVAVCDQAIYEVATDEARGSGHQDARQGRLPRAPACCRSFSLVCRNRSSSNVIRFCEESPFPVL